MKTPRSESVLLFSYGTLQDRAVQLASFGRELAGRPDSLRGYTQGLFAIKDPQVVALSGKSHHPAAIASPGSEHEIAGTVFEITAQELSAADAYEVADYKRVSVTLKSGLKAWAYVLA